MRLMRLSLSMVISVATEFNQLTLYIPGRLLQSGEGWAGSLLMLT